MSGGGTIDGAWYFDFISPFAYLQWQKLDRVRAFATIQPKPILFAALLNHLENKGPAEIPGKRVHTYEFVLWKARREGIALRMPPAHPFNPLLALRLALACNCREAAIDAIFNHIWRDGDAVDSIDALRGLATSLGVDDLDNALQVPSVKLMLKQNTDNAISQNIFGVPTLKFPTRQFWGDDATEMALDWLRHPATLDDDPEFQRARELPIGANRQ